METSPGVNIHYEDIGSGRPIVLIHGWAGSGAVWGFQRVLAEPFRLVIPDLRGHGRSTGSPEGFTLDALAADLVALFAALGLAEALLVGWSLGSQVVMEAFPMLREQVAGLVLVGGTPRFTITEGYPHGQPADAVRGISLRLKRNYGKTMGEFFRSMLAEGEVGPDRLASMERHLLAAGSLPDPAVAQAALAVLANTDLREMLPEVDRPALVIHGDADVICPPGAGRYLAEHLPAARLAEFAGVGHAPPMSRPAEFNGAVGEFLRKDLHGGD